MSQLYLYLVLNKFLLKPSTEFLTKHFSVFWKSQSNGPLAEKWGDRKSKRTRQKNQRANVKGESNDSPQIPDRAVKKNRQNGSCRPHTERHEFPCNNIHYFLFSFFVLTSPCVSVLLQSKQRVNGRRGSQGGSGSWGWCCSPCWCASVQVSSVNGDLHAGNFGTLHAVLHALILNRDLQPDIFTGFLRMVRWVWKCPLQCKSAGVYMHSFLETTAQECTCTPF